MKLRYILEAIVGLSAIVVATYGSMLIVWGFTG